MTASSGCGLVPGATRAKRRGFAAGALAASLALCAGTTGEAAEAKVKVQVGLLKCLVAGGSGFVFGSTKDLECKFARTKGEEERYTGSISKYGIDVGSTDRSLIMWSVLAPSLTIAPGALAGKYGGLTAGASVGYGGAANALIGGSLQSIVLQPLSLEAQEGLNLAVGVAALELRQ